MKRSILFFILLLSNFASAADDAFTIKQLLIERDRVVVSFKGELSEGAELVASFKDGKQCLLTVTTVKDKLANLSTSTCKLASDLVVGQKLERSMAVDESGMMEAKKADRTGEPEKPRTPRAKSSFRDGSIHGSVYAFVDSGNEITFDSVSAKSGTTTQRGDAVYRTDSGKGIGVEIWQIFPLGIGWMGGLSYDMDREVNSVKTTLDGVTIDADYLSPKPHYSFITIYGNALYEISSKFYLLLGLNYTSPTFKQGGGATGSITVSGALGGQTGAGFRITDHFSIEMLVRVVSVSVTAKDAGTDYDYGTGLGAGVHPNFKFDF